MYAPKVAKTRVQGTTVGVLGDTGSAGKDGRVLGKEIPLPANIHRLTRRRTLKGKKE